VDCNQYGTNDMKAQRVFLILLLGILLANQVVKMILKIDDVIKMGSGEE
jgi:T-complex protein 1 subunit epsilon